ncbi:MAG: hypothetical protein ACLT2Z_08195 [Eubacterium sp.]
MKRSGTGKKLEPDILISDISMANMDGLAMVAAINQNIQTLKFVF